MAEFATKRVVELSFEDALKRIPEVLKEEGFGILTEIDVQATLKKKIDVDFRKYRILGACNPPFAHQALLAEIDIGVMLPCNVIVYEGEGGKTHVSAINPLESIARLGNPKLQELAGQVAQKLARAISKL